MPILSRPGCRAPRCNRRQEPGKRFCLEHERQKWQRIDRDRGTRQQRSYTDDYLKFREWIMRLRPLSEDHLERGRMVAGEEVHHLVKAKARPDLACDPANVLVLCRRCHAERTRRGE